MFAPGHLTLGIMSPIQNYGFDYPALQGQETMVAMAERAGFAAVWVRDVPLHDPAFGDVGQMYDPWVYLGWLAAHTERIALATGSVILPLRHPIDVAKAAASADQLSGGRLVMGIATGDRPVEFPAYGQPHHRRDTAFRDRLEFIRRLLTERVPAIDTEIGRMHGPDLVPKPIAGRIPMLVTGHSGQTMDWIAEHGDGWLTYMRPPSQQREIVQSWQRALAASTDGEPPFKPFGQGLHIDLTEDPETLASPIHNGYRLGRHQLVALLDTLAAMGVNHVILVLRFGHREAADVIAELAEHVLPLFPPIET